MHTKEKKDVLRRRGAHLSLKFRAKKRPDGGGALDSFLSFFKKKNGGQEPIGFRPPREKKDF